MNTHPTKSCRRLKMAAVAVVLSIVCVACGGTPQAVEGPQPTPTPLRPTLSGSPLDAVGSGLNGTEGEFASGAEGTNGTDQGVNPGQFDPDAVDCTVHAEDPSLCTGGAIGDGVDAVRFDDSFWSYEQDGFPVYTNVTEPFPIEDVVDATISVARAELAGQNQALFPHLSNRRTAAPYVDIGVWSVTFLFAKDPVAEPAQVKVAVTGTTAEGETFEELVTYLWQWTPERWIPEWDQFREPEPTTTPTEPATPNTGGNSSGDSEGAPPAGGAWCPPGFPYAHKNGKCYANPINPNDQVGGPAITEPLDIEPEAPYGFPE